MTDLSRDPERLADADNGLLGSLLHAGRDELANPAQMADLGSRLGFAEATGSLDAPQPHAPPPPAVPAPLPAFVAPVSTTGSALLIKIVAGVGVLVMVGAATSYAPVRHDNSGSPSLLGAQSATLVRAVATETMVESTGATATPGVTSVESAPMASARNKATPAPSAQSAGSIIAPPPVAGDSEVKTLQYAQDALGTNPALTLTRCDDHRRRFPSGALAQEREVLAIDALLRIGRAAEANARARQFAKSYPTSSHLSRIATLLGTKD
jgi:hypothetical protein